MKINSKFNKIIILIIIIILFNKIILYQSIIIKSIITNYNKINKVDSFTNGFQIKRINLITSNIKLIPYLFIINFILILIKKLTLQLILKSLNSHHFLFPISQVFKNSKLQEL